MLEDCEWHSYEECLEKCCVLIPVNAAWEKGEYYRTYHFRRRDLPVPPRQVGSDVQTIHTGRRILMGNLIRVMTSRRIVEIGYEAPGKRRKPERLRLVNRDE